MYKIKLSPYHKIFYNEWLLNQGCSKYNIAFDQTLSFNLDIKRLNHSLHRLVSDYLIINSHIKQIDGEVYWVKNSKIIELEYFDSSYNHESIFNYVSAPFEVETNALYRFAIFAQSDGNYRFIVVMHHLIIDGNSFNTLINTISNYYNSSTYKINYSLSEQEDILTTSSKLFNTQLELFSLQHKIFWNKKLSGTEPIDLRWAKSESDIDQIKGYKFNFNAQEIMSKLACIVKQLDITIYIYSQCIFALLLYKYTNQSEIAISYPITIKEHVPLISGAQINTNIIVYSFKPTTTLIDLFNQSTQFIKESKAIGIRASHYPINYIMDKLNKNLLNVMFAYTNLKKASLTFNEVEVIKINSDFNIDLPTTIILELEEYNSSMEFRMRYNISDIDENIIANFISQYQHVFLKILDDLSSGIINKPLREYSILSNDEYNEIIYKKNNSIMPYKPNQNIPKLFEEQVLKTPNNIALVYEGKSITYTELNIRSNQLAHYLITKCDLKNNDLVALCLDRTEYTVISILGVLKAGCAYLPIDINSPPKRVSYILKDASIKVLITNNYRYESMHNIINQIIKPHEISLPSKNTRKQCDPVNYAQLFDNEILLIAIDDYNWQEKLNQQLANNPDINIGSNNLVYVMYTSGTTGIPKGVMLEQLSVTSRVLDMIQKTGITSISKYLFKTNYAFDVSFSDIFMTLLSGASLYITKFVFDIHEIHSLIVKNGIDICHFVPSQLEVLHEFPLKKDIFDRLQIINVSGEKFSKSLIFKSPSIKYVNYYGPTETGEVSCDITDPKNQLSEHLELETIGYPLTNSKLYVLDDCLNPLPIGAIGELYIGGASLARGYINQANKTLEKFIANPFQTDKEKTYNDNSRIYKTGDLVRYLPSGNLEYIERIDSQIKMHGFRIELDEISAKLSNYSNIKHAVVLIQDGQTKIGNNQAYLIAYYVSDNKLDEELISNYLAQELPEYMIPNVFVHLEHLPLTTNGKLDKQALSKIHIVAHTDDYIAPKNHLEQKICSMYADILKLEVDKISANANFFKLGGNSILAISLTFKLQSYLIVNVNDIFEYKTPSKLAQFLVPATNNLIDRLERIKLMYLELPINKKSDYIKIKQQRTKYQQNIRSFTFEKKIRGTSRILLTGATGYLGCHILYQLLSTTNHLLYLPIRASSKELSHTKLYHKFKFYFNIDLSIYSNRINIFPADLSKNNLALDKPEYDNLVNKIDSIMHCAAAVKYYGDTNTFYAENVQATINLLDLAKLTLNKDVHYISTIGVLTHKRISDYNYNLFTEDILDFSHANLDSIYTKTKYEGELVAIKYREFGVKTNIYRIGNLAINLNTRKTQENIEDNAFFQCVKTVLNLGMIPKELDMVEISPVDCTALAITLLFNQEKLLNQVYHLFNPKKYSLSKIFKNSKRIKIVSLSTFIEAITAQLANNIDIHQIELFVLHQWGLQPDINNLAERIIFQDKTKHILDQLNFKWTNITRRMSYISNIFNIIR
ncbi:MAG: Carrier protein [Pseudomonadota bacterium]|nr:Carrier protein [Pseudomonadota bacterium]